MDGYYCKECGKAVIILNGKIIRACPHDKATVVASMSGTVKGVGRAENQ